MSNNPKRSTPQDVEALLAELARLSAANEQLKSTISTLEHLTNLQGFFESRWQAKFAAVEFRLAQVRAALKMISHVNKDGTCAGCIAQDALLALEGSK